MDRFDRLNRETREWNNNNTDRLRNCDYSSTPKFGTAEYWRNKWNNQTYKENNGQYSRRYY